jgi:methionine aminopeptidase
VAVHGTKSKSVSASWHQRLLVQGNRQIDANPDIAITLKNPEDLEQMRIAGRLAAEVLQIVAAHVKSGVTTTGLDRVCHGHIVNVQHAIPANVGYGGGHGRIPFPFTVCTSVNNVICHGIRTVTPGATLGDVGHAIQEYAESQRFSAVRESCGHGTGKVCHDELRGVFTGRPAWMVFLSTSR